MTDTLTHALTIHQPWAWAVAAGHKPVENRTWRPSLEAVGKLIGIHAAMAPVGCSVRGSGAEGARLIASLGLPVDVVAWNNARGALIGVARLVGVVRRIEVAGGTFFERMAGRSIGAGRRLTLEDAARIRPWWRGPWGWLLEEAVLLPEPIPMRGQQGLWRIPGRPTDGRLHREWQAFDRGMEAYSAGHGRIPPPPPTANLWALEQWRRARETR